MNAKFAAELGQRFGAFECFDNHFGFEGCVVDATNGLGHYWTFCRAKLTDSSYPTCPGFGEYYSFSSGKAVAGAIVTGGVGVLAGFHGSSNIDVYCLSCGTKWNPAKRAVQERQKLAVKKAAYEDRWKKNFYKAYESGDFERATEIVTKKLPRLMRNNDLDEAYRRLKKQDKAAALVQIIFTVLIVLFFGWIVSKCS